MAARTTLSGAMLTTPASGRQGFKPVSSGPLLLHRCQPRSQIRAATICSARREVHQPDQLSQLARATGAAALLLPAALPAGALAAAAQAADAPPSQQWLTMAVLIGAGGLAAAQQLGSRTDKTEEADTAAAAMIAEPAAAVAAPEPAPVKTAPLQAVASETQAQPVAEAAAAQPPVALAAEVTTLQADGMAAAMPEPAAVAAAPAAVVEPAAAVVVAPAAAAAVATVPAPPPPAAAEPVLAASTDAVPAHMANKSKSSSASAGRTLASGNHPQGLQLAASAIPLMAAAAKQDSAIHERAAASQAPQARSNTQQHLTAICTSSAASSTPAAAAPAQQQDEGKGRAVLAFLTAPLQWPAHLVAAIWAWIRSLAGSSRPAAA